MITASLGERVLLRRRDKKMSQHGLAEKAGVSTNTIARLERGEIQAINSNNLKRLAMALDVSADYLLDMPERGRELERVS